MKIQFKINKINFFLYFDLLLKKKKVRRNFCPTLNIYVRYNCQQIIKREKFIEMLTRFFSFLFVP